MSRTKHHRDTLSPRRYRLLDWPPRRRFLRALWHKREAVVEALPGRRPARRARASSARASKWIGNKLDLDGVLLIKCMRCGGEDRLKMPANARSPLDVPVGFDEKLFSFKRGFQLAHESCIDTRSEN